ncbi:Hypothetical predicted protein [Olea europaea subsp. europaea]|uniref:Uncharacterized protein n=1 Tax=Olea europaea subsp. europaea TaxID=158383 RepID=A0A8S0RHF2_OLEEU|nr:Hypothetical predicted protein [Olea europaea subsp. europaea]
MRQKNTLCDHDYGNRPTDITAMTPNEPQSENRKTCQFASAHDNDMNVVNKPVEMLAITTMPT